MAAFMVDSNSILTQRYSAVSRKVFNALAVTCLLCLALAVGMAASQAAEQTGGLRERAFPIERVKSYSYHSKRMDRNYDIVVSVPRDYASQPQKRYPVLLVTDGHYSFEIAHSVWQIMEDEIDPPILVSIGAPLEEGRDASVARRVHEFSPPGWSMNDAFGQMVKELPSCKAAAGVGHQPCVGGAPAFYAFITSELLPEVSKAYRIDTNDVGLYGHSAGGFFASWAIFQGDARFKRFIIGSPAMAYGDGEIFRREEQYAQTRKDLPVSVYLGSGSLEQSDPFLEYVGKIVSGHVHFGAALTARKYPSLKVYSEIHQNLGHGETAPMVLARGFRLLYPKTP